MRWPARLAATAVWRMVMVAEIRVRVSWRLVGAAIARLTARLLLLRRALLLRSGCAKMVVDGISDLRRNCGGVASFYGVRCGDVPCCGARFWF